MILKYLKALIDMRKTDFPPITLRLSSYDIDYDHSTY
jgi:hypothetical protein